MRFFGEMKEKTHLMSLGDLFQRIHLVDADLQLAGLQVLEQLVDVELELFPSLDVAEQLGTGDLETLGREFAIPPVSIVFTKGKKAGVTYLISSGGTGPLAFPNQMMVPFFRTASMLPSQVSLPTESYTTSTPLPPVASLTLLTQSLPSSLR